jgi:hypothetical protein
MDMRWTIPTLMLALLAPWSFGCNDYGVHEDNDPYGDDDDDTVMGDDDDTDPGDDDTGPGDDDDTAPYGDDDDDDDTDTDPMAGFPIGRVVTILLTLSDDWMDPDVSADLLHNSVQWCSPIHVSDPVVLVIRDDNHNNEDTGDSDHIYDTLVSRGYDVDLIEEPSGGIDQSALFGYHVVILSNPGHSPDDLSTLQWLYDFSAEGFGVIFQGDDMSHFDDGSFDMSTLTRLTYIDNGTSYYGHDIDNDSGDAYEVTLETNGHALVAGIAGEVFRYGNDIDTTEPADIGESVVAWATVEGTNYALKPAVAAYSVW